MGQLEKYGLYVLCLLIFLILGVTLWGWTNVVLLHFSWPQHRQPAPTNRGQCVQPIIRCHSAVLLYGVRGRRSKRLGHEVTAICTD